MILGRSRRFSMEIQASFDNRAPSKAKDVIPPPGIVCRSVTFGFDSARPILDDLELQVQSGEVLSLLGPSGCGKSTLLKLMAGLLQPQRGSVALVNHQSDDRRLSHWKERTSFVFQESTLLPWRSVAANIRLPLELRRQASGPQVVDQIRSMLEVVGLAANDGKKFPNELSGGMKMRASLARALITDPDVMLLDEPFAALDDILRMRLNELLVQLWMERRRTVVFVTHNIAEAVFLSHRIAIMGRGQVAEIIPIELPFPRTRVIRSLPSFAKWFGRISERLEEASR